MDNTNTLFLALILVLMVPWAINQFRLMAHYPDLDSLIYLFDDDDDEDNRNGRR